MNLPRFSSGSVGLLDYRALNDAFTAIERLDGEPRFGKRSTALRESFVAEITQTLPSAVQGNAQADGTTETGTGGATFVKAYLYDWAEVTLGVGDGITPVGSGVSWKDAQRFRGIDLLDGAGLTPPQSYYPAVDFSPVQRYAANDLVALTRVTIRSGSKYSSIYSMSPLSHQAIFLARLTVDRSATGVGLYEWAGLTRSVSGTLATTRLAQNLYERNNVQLASAYGTTLYAGSNNWGHGQVLTGGGGLGTMTKNPLPVGGEGVGTIVSMHEVGVNQFVFYAVAPVTPACPV